MRSYHEVVERYHVEYLNGYDASVLRDVLSVGSLSRSACGLG